MRQRVLTSLMVLTALLVSVLLATMPVIGQSPAGKTKKSAYTPPKLPWGDPDLQGLWPGTDLIEVPLQRDLKAGERVEVTQEEFAQRQAKAEQTRAKDNVLYASGLPIDTVFQVRAFDITAKTQKWIWRISRSWPNDGNASIQAPLFPKKNSKPTRIPLPKPLPTISRHWLRATSHNLI